MDGHYQAHVQMPYFQGASRQRGKGLGSMAFAVARTALPIFKKFILPAAKRIGKTALEFAAPELLEVIAGRTKPKQALKRVAKKTAKAQLGGGVKKKTMKKAPIRKRAPAKSSRVDILQNLS
jgi:hypothetical protein